HRRLDFLPPCGGLPRRGGGGRANARLRAKRTSFHGETADNRRTLRQPILYAHEMWRRQRLWVIFLLVVGVGASVATLVYPQLRSNRDSLNWIFFAYVPAGLLLGGGLLFYRWRSRAEVSEEGLKIGTLFSEVLIEYELVRTVRVQPL